jgi:predicted alpha/beta superfamily hydrolase
MEKTHHLKISLTDDSAEKGAVYLTGNFNGWKPADRRYQMTPQGDHHYQIEIPTNIIPEEGLAYKYTRGDWSAVELNHSGKHTPNRKWESGMNSPEDTVAKWLHDPDLSYPDFYPIIEDLSTKFTIPEPVKTRRISILLPWNYNQSSEKYPVVYLQDGQNLFQDKSPYGNWHIDRKAARLAAQKGKGIIILAVDHSNENRIAEYMPPHIPDRAEAYGKDYVAFLINEVIPYINRNYRTKEDAGNTIIGGSSMGGLISLYAQIAYPRIFGKALIFSPSLWVIPNIRDWLYQNKSADEETVTYIYCGGRESREMVTQVMLLYQGLMELNRDKEVMLTINSLGEHNETFWGEAFYQSLEFILQES